MVTSFWGDDHMFFRHQRMEDDLKLRPEWEPYTPKFSVFGNTVEEATNTIVNTIVANCPFAYLFQ